MIQGVVRFLRDQTQTAEYLYADKATLAELRQAGTHHVVQLVDN